MKKNHLSKQGAKLNSDQTIETTQTTTGIVMSSSETEEPKPPKTSKVARSCEIVTNIDNLPASDGVSGLNLFLNRLNGRPAMIKHYAMIVHDKDKDDAGNSKAPHIHAILELTSGYRFTNIASYFEIPVQQIEVIHAKRPYGKKKATDIGLALSYLTHRNAPDKYQYPDEAVIASEGWNWKLERAKSEARITKGELGVILDAINDGTIALHNLSDYVDIHTYVQNKKEIDAAFRYKAIKDGTVHDRSIEVIFIHGSSGTGKTTIAKLFCEKQGLDYCVTGSDNDPFQDYSGQHALILDDLRPESFAPNDLLKILDNNTGSLVKRRYHNITLDVRVIIITSTTDIDNYFDQYYTEDIIQLRRRCKTKIEISPETVTIYEYQSDTDTYQKVTEFTNPVKKKYNTDTDSSHSLDWILSGFSFDGQPIEKSPEYIELKKQSQKTPAQEPENLTIYDFLNEDEGYIPFE